MSQNGNGVGAKVDESIDNSHLLVELTQESYNVVQDVMREAPAGSQGHSFDWWLESLLRAGANAKLNTWRQRDRAKDGIAAVELLRKAQAGDVSAKVKLAQMFKLNVE